MCGAKTTLARESSAPIRAGGPYRSAEAVTSEIPPREMQCTYCGNVCSSSVRVCPHCDVRFDNVRCARCYTLQEPGSFFCRRCRQPLELEPLLDPTDAPCPRCFVPLEAAGGGDAWQDARVHECPRCGGLFVPREALAEILHRAEQFAPFADRFRSRPPPALGEVRYLPCPLCHTKMNRVNFGKASGVIVDVCSDHGTWFDAGELTRAVAFVAGGGLAKTRAREE